MPLLTYLESSVIFLTSHVLVHEEGTRVVTSCRPEFVTACHGQIEYVYIVDLVTILLFPLELCLRYHQRRLPQIIQMYFIAGACEHSPHPIHVLSFYYFFLMF